MPPLFSYGFRPFFLGAALVALIVVPLWTWSLAWSVALPLAWLPVIWHAHEMVFGFVGAAIAGFLLTAVPSWTGRKGFAGTPLVLLFLTWVAGRLVTGLSAGLPAPVVAIVTLAFFPGLAALIAPPLVRERNRNTPLLLVLLALWVCQAVFQWAAWHDDAWTARQAVLAAIDVILVLVTVIGGRIVPSFTATALRLGGSTHLPRARRGLTPVVVSLMIAVVATDLLVPGSRWAGVMAALAAIAQAYRFAQWQSLRTLRMPIVWILHLAYAWLPIGLALKAWSLLDGADAAAHWLHALTVGAIATMIVAVMTRTSLGHTGRPLVLHRLTVVAYVLLALATLVRVVGPALPGVSYITTIVVSAGLWASAFTLFLGVYGPILTRPRVTDAREVRR
jgi:uncharacterized protein involved in response to NO